VDQWIQSSQHVIGSAFDEFLLHASKRARVLVNMGRKRATPQEIEQLESWMSYYLSQPYAEHPARFFSFPRKAPEADILEEKSFSNGQRRLYAFRSGYRVRNPDFMEYFKRFERNRTAYLVHWRHGDQGRNTIVCCHGYSLGDPAQAERMFRIRKLYRMGLDVALFITPFHWKRASSPLLRFSPPFPFQHPVLGLEGFGQAMYDLAMSFLLLKETGAARMGIIGASLGGYLTALFVSLTRMAELASLVVPLLSFHNLRIFTGRFPATVGKRSERQPLQEEISALWKIHSPLSLRPKLAPERCLLIASKGDRLCPFEDVQRLYEHWGQPANMFLRGGHALFFPRRARGEAWYAFLREHGFV